MEVNQRAIGYCGQDAKSRAVTLPPSNGMGLPVMTGNDGAMLCGVSYVSANSLVESEWKGLQHQVVYYTTSLVTVWCNYATL